MLIPTKTQQKILENAEFDQVPPWSIQKEIDFLKSKLIADGARPENLLRQSWMLNDHDYYLWLETECRDHCLCLDP